MLRRSVRNDGTIIARRCAPVLLLLPGLLAIAPPSRAQINLGPVTVGAGLRTSFVDTEPTGADSTDKFLLNDIRLYVNGPVTDTLDMRIAARVNESGAWQNGYALNQGQTIGGKDFINGRISALWKPTSNFKALLSVNGWHDTG